MHAAAYMSENPMTNEIDGNDRGSSVSIRRRQSKLAFPDIEVEGTVAQAVLVNRDFRTRESGCCEADAIVPFSGTD